MPRSSNKLPTKGDAVLRYNYRDHSHEDRATGEVLAEAGVAVGGGYYVHLKDQTVIAVEQYDDLRKEWIEKRPRFVGSPNLQRNAQHQG